MNGLVERTFARERELGDLSRKLTLRLFVRDLRDLRGAVDQFLFDGAVWRFESARSQLRSQIIHCSFVGWILASEPSSDGNDPLSVQPSDLDVSEATPARQVILSLLHALVLEERIDDRLGPSSPRIIVHLAHVSYPRSLRPASAAGFVFFLDRSCTLF
jgi:hypothetical protein